MMAWCLQRHPCPRMCLHFRIKTSKAVSRTKAVTARGCPKYSHKPLLRGNSGDELFFLSGFFPSRLIILSSSIQVTLSLFQISCSFTFLSPNKRISISFSISIINRLILKYICLFGHSTCQLCRFLHLLQQQTKVLTQTVNYPLQILQSPQMRKDGRMLNRMERNSL